MIDEALVEGVAGVVDSNGFVPQLADTLKAAYPGVRFTLCTEDDIHSGKPVYTSEACEIYLVGSSDHCLTLTNDYELATGVVIAEIIDDDD